MIMDHSQLQSHRPQGAPNMGVFFSPPEATKSDTFSPQEISTRLPSLREMLGGSPADDRIVTSIFQSKTQQTPLSPPVSPHTQDHKDHAQSEPELTHQRDPVLFPTRFARSLSPHQPLLSATEISHASKSDDSIIDQHTRARNAQGWTSQRPSRDEYEAVLSFKTNIVARYNINPHIYITKEMEHLGAYPSRFAQAHAADIPAKPTNKRRADDDSDERLVKRQRVRRPAERQVVPRRAARPSPRERHVDDFDEDVVSSTKHRRNPSGISATKDKAKVERRWQDIPNYCPPVSSILPGTKLRIDWKGAPFDLSSDPDRDMIDDTEVELVSVLRLTCAQYLRAKRSIFEKYIEDAKIGKAFNKTAAQGVCQMDVNKASRLYLAFEKVGWFDRHHFQKLLQG